MRQTTLMILPVLLASVTLAVQPTGVISLSLGGSPVVTGKMPGSDQAAGLRVLIFSPGS